MMRRAWWQSFAILALPVSLLSATPAVQWCTGLRVPLTDEQFAACLLAEASGCASQAAGAGACGASTSACAADGGDAGVGVTSCGVEAERPACDPGAGSRACDSGPDGASCDGASDPDPAADTGSPEAPASRAFCVGSPSGGFALLPLPDLDGPALDAVLVSGDVELAPPARPALPNLDRSGTDPPLDRGAAPHAIRGPPSA